MPASNKHTMAVGINQCIFAPHSTCCSLDFDLSSISPMVAPIRLCGWIVDASLMLRIGTDVYAPFRIGCTGDGGPEKNSVPGVYGLLKAESLSSYGS